VVLRSGLDSRKNFRVRPRLPYNPRLNPLARELRNQSTLAEILLWQQLKGGQRKGYDFHRQKPIDEYIVDFFAADLLLAIEIDGESHVLKGEADEVRQTRLEELGVRLLRFDDAAVKADIDAVVRAIDRWIEGNAVER
jgi:very-short-patch-repair endonuclease